MWKNSGKMWEKYGKFFEIIENYGVLYIVGKVI